MKFILKGPFPNNIYTMMKRAGYYFLNKDGEKSEFNFIRPLQRRSYPRFHIYVKKENDDLFLNLHLDQKKPIYKGTAAHSGEYKGELVEKEAERIKQIIK